ncbi:hypothetical protein D3C87_1557730 [compost metagenome]
MKLVLVLDVGLELAVLFAQRLVALGNLAEHRAGGSNHHAGEPLALFAQLAGVTLPVFELLAPLLHQGVEVLDVSEQLLDLLLVFGCH